MIEFLCGCDERTWSNEIVFISQYPDKCEFQLRYDGNEIEVIVGKSTKGNWICIPLMKSGLELAYFKDEFGTSQRYRGDGPNQQRAISQSIYNLNEARIIVYSGDYFIYLRKQNIR